MKKAKELAMIVLVSTLVGIAITGLLLLINKQQNKFTEQDRKECAKVAQLAGGLEHMYEHDTCYLIKENSFIKVEI